MTTIIKRLMPKSLPQDINLTEDDLEEIYFQLFLWNLKFTDSSQLYANLIKYGKSEPRSQIRPSQVFKNWLSEYRWSVLYEFDAVRLKLCVLELIFNKVDDKTAAEGFFFSRGLPRDSAILYLYLLNDRKVWPKFKDQLKKVLSDEIIQADIITDWRLLIRQCNEDFVQYKLEQKANNYAYNKLRFIADSNRMDISDLKQDLTERAVAYYYRERPFKGRLYAVNYAKSSLDGRTLQLINYWTRSERSRLLNGEDVNENTAYTNRIVHLSDELIASSHLGNSGVWDNI